MSEQTLRPPRQPLVPGGQIDHHAADMTATASTDLTLEALQAQLGTHDQWLPIDGDPKQTLGRLVEMNSTGPLRLGYGGWRDLLLGAQFTLKKGALITAGGRTMKNVAGYDVSKFMIGSFGRFGKLVTITTRTYLRPSGALLAKFEPAEVLVNQLLPATSRPHWMMLAGGSLWCGYLGDDKSIAFYESDLAQRRPLEMRRHSLAEDIAFRAAHWLPDRPAARFRCSVPPTGLSDFIRRSELKHFSADPAFGVAVGSAGAERKPILRKIAEELGGRIAFDDAEDISSFFGANGAQAALLNRIHAAFDQ